MKATNQIHLLFYFFQFESTLTSPSKGCCLKQIVTAPSHHMGVYHLKRESVGEEDSGCKDSCVYSRQGYPGKEYCFQSVTSGADSIQQACEVLPANITEITPNFTCAQPSTFILQNAENVTSTYSWEQCGNLCYLSEKCKYWSFWNTIPGPSCFLFNSLYKQGYISKDSKGAFTGDRNCPGMNIFFPFSNPSQLRTVLSIIMRDGGM